MELGIVGGTGDLGRGLAVRGSNAGHRIAIGSRKREKAEDAAEDCLERANEDAVIAGMTNQEAVEGVDLVVLTLPYKYTVGTIEDLDLPGDATVVTPVVPMERDEDGFKYVAPEEGSAAAEIREVLDSSLSLAGAFHNIAAKRLYRPDAELGIDVAVFGEEEAKDEVMEFIESVEGMRGLDAGNMAVASQVEAITPLLINVGMRNKMKNLGIRFV